MGSTRMTKSFNFYYDKQINGTVDNAKSGNLCWVDTMGTNSITWQCIHKSTQIHQFYRNGISGSPSNVLRVIFDGGNLVWELRAFNKITWLIALCFTSVENNGRLTHSGDSYKVTTASIYLLVGQAGTRFRVLQFYGLKIGEFVSCGATTVKQSHLSLEPGLNLYWQIKRQKPLAFYPTMLELCMLCMQWSGRFNNVILKIK